MTLPAILRSSRLVSPSFLAAVAALAFGLGASVALAEPYACTECRQAYDRCMLAGGGDNCWFTLEMCLVRNGCWVN
jgi:hypothetical protein